MGANIARRRQQMRTSRKSVNKKFDFGKSQEYSWGMKVVEAESPDPLEKPVKLDLDGGPRAFDWRARLVEVLGTSITLFPAERSASPFNGPLNVQDAWP